MSRIIIITNPPPPPPNGRASTSIVDKVKEAGGEAHEFETTADAIAFLESVDE